MGTQTMKEQELADVIAAAWASETQTVSQNKAVLAAVKGWIEAEFPGLTVQTNVDLSGGRKAVADVLVNDHLALILLLGVGGRNQWKQVDRDALIIASLRPDIETVVLVHNPKTPNIVKDRKERGNRAAACKSGVPWLGTADPESLTPLIDLLEGMTK